MVEIDRIALSTPIKLKSGKFTLKGGRKYALIGPSGAGKSTFLRAISGFLPVESGSIRANQIELTTLPPAARPVSMLFQGHNLFMHLTIEQNIALGLGATAKLSTEVREQVAEVAASMNLQDCLNSLPRAASGGQLARAALARVVLQARDIVLFDEAFGAVGPAQAQKLRDIVDEKLVAMGRVVMFSSHLPHDFKDWSDEVIWLNANVINNPIPSEYFFSNLPADAKAYLVGSDAGEYR